MQHEAHGEMEGSVLLKRALLLVAGYLAVMTLIAGVYV